MSVNQLYYQSFELQLEIGNLVQQLPKALKMIQGRSAYGLAASITHKALMAGNVDKHNYFKYISTLVKMHQRLSIEVRALYESKWIDEGVYTKCAVALTQLSDTLKTHCERAHKAGYGDLYTHAFIQQNP